MASGSQYFFGPYALDAARRQLTRGADAVPLTARAFDVLLALLERHGETVEKEQLLQRVWPDTVVEEANLSQQIFTIRKLLGQTDDEPYVATVPRRGYRFVAAVREMSGAPVAETRVAGDQASPVRLAIPFAAAAPLASIPNGVIAISPDGSRIVYAAVAGTSTRLYLRPLRDFTAAAIAGTEEASNPFFSPDGEWIGFQSGRRLQKLPLAGGPPITLCDVADLRGASWGANGDIVFAPGPTSGLWRVPASGGAASPLTSVDFDGGERTHRWPHVLPDGRGVIFTVGHAGATSFDEASLAIAELDVAGHRLLLRHATDGRFVHSGHVIWARGATLFAAPFDLDARRVGAAARPVQSGVATNATGIAHFACSKFSNAAAAGGVLVHVPGEAQSLRRSLVSVDRTGMVTKEYAAGEALEEPRVAPDGRSVVVSLRGRTSDLWRYRFSGGALERVTFEGENFAGIWGPEPGMLTFSSSRGGGPSDIYCVQPDRASAPELLIASEFDKAASSWSPDGSALLFTEYHPDTGADIWLLDRKAAAARPFLRTRFNEYAPVFSPDGRLVVYTTDESGRPEIHALSCPDAAGKRQLSVDGGAEPVWSRDGRELFYRSGDRLMRVDMSRGAGEAGVPATMLEGKYASGTVTLANYDVSLDGTEFLMVQTAEPAAPAALHVTLGWTIGRSS